MTTDATERPARVAKMHLLRKEGLSYREIGDRYGVTAQAVHWSLTAHPLPPPGRPRWSVPDRLLLAEAHDARREIEQREGFRRPPA